MSIIPFLCDGKIDWIIKRVKDMNLEFSNKNASITKCPRSSYPFVKPPYAAVWYKTKTGAMANINILQKRG